MKISWPSEHFSLIFRFIGIVSGYYLKGPLLKQKEICALNAVNSTFTFMSKLPNAPLQEVIFEVRWALKPDPRSGQILDEGYELASGRLSTIVEEDFPYYRRILPPDLPEQLLPYQVVHQYWTAENKWPVLQLGPGVFTVNCTDEAYDWEKSFRQLIEQGLKWLMQAYRESLNIRLASLKYIDAIKVDDYGGIEGGWQNFVSSHLNFEFTNLFNTRGRQKQIQVNQTFELEDGSELQLQISDAFRNNDKALVWQTAIIKKDLFDEAALLQWTDYAHSITQELFKELVKPDLYASFSRKNQNKNR